MGVIGCTCVYVHVCVYVDLYISISIIRNDKVQTLSRNRPLVHIE